MGVAGPARVDPALACSHGQGGKTELFSLSAAKRNKQKKTQNAWCLCWKSRSYGPHRKREQWSFAVTSVLFCFLKFSVGSALMQGQTGKTAIFSKLKQCCFK